MSPPPSGRIRPGSPPATRPTANLDALKELVRLELTLSADDVVLVSELRCAEVGCPPIETVVVVLDEVGHRKWQFPQPPEEVTAHTLRHALVAEPQGQELANG